MARGTLDEEVGDDVVAWLDEVCVGVTVWLVSCEAEVVGGWELDVVATED